MTPAAMAMTETMLEAALALAKRGWPVFPIHYPKNDLCSCGKGDACSSPAKHPITEAGFKDATTDPGVIRSWWERHPEANIGVPTGSVSRLAVLDIDDPQSFLDLTQKHGTLPPTLMAKTGGGGVHLFYSYSEGVRNTAGLWPKIDVRGEGGYVLVAPSRHVSGQRYEWGDQAVAPAPWPELLVELSKKPKPRPAVSPRPADAGAGTAYGLAALDKELGILARALEGERNDTLNKAAFNVFRLVAGGELDDITATADLTAVASRIGLESTEIRATLSSARDAGFAEPRTAPNALYKIDSIDKTSGWSSSNGDSVNTVNFVDVDEPPAEPILLQRYGVPDFPLEALPTWLATYVEHLARATQVTPDVPASFALAAVATVIGGVVWVEPTLGWVEGTNIFTAVALEPGERKSAVHKEVTRPIRDLEKELVEEALPGLIEARTKKAIAETQANKALADAGKASPENRTVLEAEAQEMALAAEEIAVPPEPRLFADDTTPEALISLMAEQGGRMAVLSAEGTLFDILAGRYSKEPNLDAVLKGHANDPIRVDRKNRGAEYVEEPALTIAIAIQPSVLEGLAMKREFRGRGMLARWAWCLPGSLVGRRQVNPDPMPDHVRSTYISEVKRLGRSLRDRERIELTFSDDAQAPFHEWCVEVEKNLGPAGSLEYLRDWGAKLTGLTARLAGILHFAELGEQGIARQVSATTIKNAITLGRYFMAHAQRAFEYMGADPIVGQAMHVLKWMQREEKAEFSRRDAHVALQGTFKKAKDLEPVLDFLVAHGWLTPVAPEEKRGPGRPAGPRYRVTKSTVLTQPFVADPPKVSNGFTNGSSNGSSVHLAPPTEPGEWGEAVPRLEESP